MSDGVSASADDTWPLIQYSNFMGVEGPRRNDVRKHREFDSEEVKNLTLNRSKR